MIAGRQGGPADLLAGPEEIRSWPGATPVTHTREWIAAEHGRSGSSPRLIAAPDGRAPTVLIPCFSLDRGHRHADYDPAEIWSPRSSDEVLPLDRATFSPASGAKLAVAAVPHSGDGPVITASGAGSHDLCAAVEGFECWGRKAGCDALAFIGIPGESRLLGLLEERGYRRVPTEPWAFLEGIPGTLEQWLQALGRGKRQTVRKEMEAVAAHAQMTVVGSEGLDAESSRILVDHYAKFGHPRDEARVAGLFNRLRENHRDNLCVVLANTKDGERAGFGAMVLGDGSAHHRLVASTGAPGLHFSLLFYEPVRLASAARISRIDYGSTSYEGKLLRGCALRELWALVRQTQP